MFEKENLDSLKPGLYGDVNVCFFLAKYPKLGKYVKL